MAGQQDDELDFTSSNFNPAKALSSSSVQLPDPEAKEYEDLYNFRDTVHSQNLHVVRELPGVLGPAGIPKPLVRRAPIDRNFTPEQGLLRGRGRRRRRNVITRMEEMMGPLALLKECRDLSLRVKVYTRNHSEVRGVLSGFVVAFDKHWNLVLRDVDEVFQKRLHCKAPALGDVSNYVRVSDLSIRESVPGGDRDSLSNDDDSERPATTPAATTSQGKGGGEARRSGEVERRRRKQEAVEEAATRSLPVAMDNPGASETQDALRLALATETQGQEEQGEARKKGRKRKKREIRKRHVNQLFVRGENVVLVSVVKP